MRGEVSYEKVVTITGVKIHMTMDQLQTLRPFLGAIGVAQVIKVLGFNEYEDEQSNYQYDQVRKINEAVFELYEALLQAEEDADQASYYA